MAGTQTILLATWREPGEVALKAGWEARVQGADLLTTLEKGLAAAELDETMLAIGLGSLPNSEGVIELDASMMDGANLNAGAVCAVQDICPVISVAKLVLETTPHVMLAGDQARRFAIDHGFEPQNLNREFAQQHYREWLETQSKGKTLTAEDYVHSVKDIDGQHIGDTVTMLGLEQPNHVVAASSTSGLAWKLPGRVGDSPIIGAGIYADDEAGCAGATGLGEELWKAVASFRTVMNMKAGMSPQEACDETVLHMLRRQPGVTEIPCVVFALGLDGSYGAATTAGEFTLWVCEDGEFSSYNYSALTS